MFFVFFCTYFVFWVFVAFAAFVASSVFRRLNSCVAFVASVSFFGCVVFPFLVTATCERVSCFFCNFSVLPLKVLTRLWDLMAAVLLPCCLVVDDLFFLI